MVNRWLRGYDDQGRSPISQPMVTAFGQRCASKDYCEGRLDKEFRFDSVVKTTKRKTDPWFLVLGKTSKRLPNYER
jgi:hypothetical protein